MFTAFSREIDYSFSDACHCIYLSLLQAVNPWALWWGVIHTDSPSPVSTIPCVLHREPQVFHVVLDDVGPSLSLSNSTSLSMDVCLEDSFDTFIFFSPLYMPNHLSLASRKLLPFLPCCSNSSFNVLFTSSLGMDYWTQISEVLHLLQSLSSSVSYLQRLCCLCTYARTIVSVLSAFTLRPLLSRASCHSLNLSWSLAGEIYAKLAAV